MSEGLANPPLMVNPLHGVLREISAVAKYQNPEMASWKRVKQAILSAAEFLRAEAHQSSPPISVREIARLRRIYRIEFFHSTGGPEAVLVPTREGFLIRLPLNRPKVRHRSSIAHEIGHTFFYDFRGGWPVRLVSRGSAGRLSQKEEDICKAFARELLMPRGQVGDEKKANPGKKGMALLSHLAARFQVSEELATVRLMWDLADLEACVAIFRDGEAQASPRESSLRRYFGKTLRSLRKREKQILAAVTHAMANGPVQQALTEIASENQNFIGLEWKVIQSRTHQSAVALLEFSR